MSVQNQNAPQSVTKRRRQGYYQGKYLKEQWLLIVIAIGIISWFNY